MTASNATELTLEQRLELYYWMKLTRVFDDTMVNLWKQGQGVGGTFSERGHEAISVAAGYVLAPDDVVAPMHRDLGCYLVRGITPDRIFGNLLGKATGVSHGRDANLHGMGDLDHNIVGFISHLPQSLPVTVGVAMSFQYRNEPRVALTFVGDGSASAGVFHESMNLAAIHNAPVVVIIENNQYAYSTPVTHQTRVQELSKRADAYGIPGVTLDGNDVEAMVAGIQAAVDRARRGDGPTLIEAKTMRMLGHAMHDGFEYVPRELLAEWAAKDPVDRFAARLRTLGVDQVELDEIDHRCNVEVTAALEHAQAAPLPDAATVTQGVYAP